MEKGLLYLIISLSTLFLVFIGAIKKRFHTTKFTLSLFAVVIIPGLMVAFGEGMLLLASRPNIWQPLLIGFIIGLALYQLLFKRIWGFSTFEHELTHALVALFFFRRITKFVVTRHNGGYVENLQGFGGKTGNYLIALGPYFLPTFTLISVMVRPFLPAAWLPLYDVWIGITLSYQTMSNIEEMKGNWTGKLFRPAGGGALAKTDIGKEGFIFSFIIILTLKLLFLSMLMFIVSNGYSAMPEWFMIIWTNSTGFFFTVVNVIYHDISSMYLN
jgi:hypothetical protein